MIDFNQKFCNIPVYFWIVIICFLVFVFINSNNNNIENMSETPKNINVHLCKANWCGHCTHFLPTWNKLIKHFDTHSHIVFNTNDCSSDVPDVCKNEPGFPSIFIIDSADKRFDYSGDRSLNSLIDFINSV